VLCVFVFLYLSFISTNYYSFCIIIFQCKQGFAGDGEFCELDSDLDGRPDIDLVCVGRGCEKVNKYFLKL